MWVQLVGGLGMFLLGMVLLTDSLKSLAGRRLREILTRYTDRPGKALLTGAGITALVQSSSATTLATIGLVSSGLMGFSQSIGVILGASVGTTSTGWIVSLVGLKYGVSAFALPLVAAGALARLLLHGRWATTGLAVAGFGLLFVGIDLMQSGMEGIAAGFDVTDHLRPGFVGVLILVGVGAVVTILTQSSSAAVATTLSALAAGAIDLHSAAYLVIGHNIGTTLTGVLGSLGATISARRTAYTHVLLNLTSGVLAIVLLRWLLAGATAVAGPDNGPFTIAVFHTSFTLLGALLFLPWTAQLARFMTRILPEHGVDPTRHLGSALATMPHIAAESTRRALAEIAVENNGVLRGRLEVEGLTRRAVRRLEATEAALIRTRTFLRRITEDPDTGLDPNELEALMRAVERLETQCRDLRLPITLVPLQGDPAYGPLVTRMRSGLDRFAAWTQQEKTTAPDPEEVADLEAVNVLRKDLRRSLVTRTAARGIDLDSAVEGLEAAAWLRRQAEHVLHIWGHLTPADKGTTQSPSQPTGPAAGHDGNGASAPPADHPGPTDRPGPT